MDKAVNSFWTLKRTLLKLLRTADFYLVKLLEANVILITIYPLNQVKRNKLTEFIRASELKKIYNINLRSLNHISSLP